MKDPPSDSPDQMYMCQEVLFMFTKRVIVANFYLHNDCFEDLLITVIEVDLNLENIQTSSCNFGVCTITSQLHLHSTSYFAHRLHRC